MHIRQTLTPVHGHVDRNLIFKYRYRYRYPYAMLSHMVRQLSCAYHCMVLLTLHGTSCLLPVSQPRHYEPGPSILSEHGIQGSGHILHAPFYSLSMHWAATHLHWRLNYVLQVLFGQLLCQHRLIGLHRAPDDQDLEAGGVLVQGDLVPVTGQKVKLQKVKRQKVKRQKVKCKKSKGIKVKWEKVK